VCIGNDPSPYTTLRDFAFAEVCAFGIKGSIFCPARPVTGLPSSFAIFSAAQRTSRPISVTVDLNQPSPQHAVGKIVDIHELIDGCEIGLHASSLHNLP
jgi:hypothetical protein